MYLKNKINTVWKNVFKYEYKMGERAFNAQPSDRKRWRIKNKRGKRLRDDKARSRTRVNIASAFQHRRELKERKACDRTPRVLCFFSIGE